MSAVQRHMEQQAATNRTFRAYLKHLVSCTAECGELPPARCPEGAELYRAHQDAQNAERVVACGQCGQPILPGEPHTIKASDTDSAPAAAVRLHLQCPTPRPDLETRPT